MNSGEVRLWSRNAIEWTDKLPAVVEAIKKLGLASASLDGELIAGLGTKEDFNLLQSTLSGERDGLLTYTLFDILHLNGVDVSGAPLVERKALLKTVLRTPKAPLAFSAHVKGDGATAYKLAAQQHFEGIISKRADCSRSFQRANCADASRCAPRSPARSARFPAGPQ